jgi:hypothetical protein
MKQLLSPRGQRRKPALRREGPRRNRSKHGSQSWPTSKPRCRPSFSRLHRHRQRQFQRQRVQPKQPGRKSPHRPLQLPSRQPSEMQRPKQLAPRQPAKGQARARRKRAHKVPTRPQGEAGGAQAAPHPKAAPKWETKPRRGLSTTKAGPSTPCCHGGAETKHSASTWTAKGGQTCKTSSRSCGCRPNRSGALSTSGGGGSSSGSRTKRKARPKTQERCSCEPTRISSRDHGSHSQAPHPSTSSRQGRPTQEPCLHRRQDRPRQKAGQARHKRWPRMGPKKAQGLRLRPPTPPRQATKGPPQPEIGQRSWREGGQMGSQCSGGEG